MDAMPLFNISLAGSPVSFSCEEGENLLRAGLRQGVPLAYECNVGACGSCKFDLIEGSVDEISTASAGLKPRERERGKRLACQCIPTSDCTVRMRTGLEFKPQITPRRREVTLESVRDITHDIRELTLRAAEPAEFLPGQYALLHMPDCRMPRAYSMSNLPNEEGYWQFMVRRVPGGAVSPFLCDECQPGQRLMLEGPYGLAYMRESVQRGLVCIAGGSGIAPIASILKRAGQLTSGTGREVYFFYGGRGPLDVPSLEHLFGSEVGCADIRFYPVVSEPGLVEMGRWDGEVGLVHDVVAERLEASRANYEYYVAGPPPMIEATVKHLMVDQKVPATQIHFDRFF
ncbi:MULTISPECIES: 2Fe-2S iron-sulfur cluster-binding protein [Burkholderia]|nr:MULTISPECIES: 2Fe-2S iron-sulfur cluster-binding protein [Burkholderia]